MILYALGGGIEGSGGLSILVATSDNRKYQIDSILLDCGKRTFKNNSNQTIPQFSTSLSIIESQASIKAIIISHAHVDHFGALPDAATFAPHAPIYVPEGSKQLISLQLRKKGLFSSWYEDDVSNEEAMTRAIELIIARIQEIPFYKGFYVPNSSFYFEFIPAGHIIGSAMIYLKQYNESLLFSGDFFPSQVLSTRPLDLNIISTMKIDLFLCEATMLSKYKKLNGSNNNSEKQDSPHLSDFKQTIRNVVEKQGDCTILTSAVGIAQELICCLLREFAQSSKKLRIVLDDANYEVTKLYLSNINKSFLQIALSANAEFLNLHEYFLKLRGNAKKDQIMNIFFVTPQTMKKNQHLRQYFFPDKRNILILAYSPTELRIDKDKNTESEMRQHLATILNISENEPFECDVVHVPCFMHPNYLEIKEIISKIVPKKVYFMHGYFEDADLDFLKRAIAAINKHIFLIPIKNHMKYGENTNENE